MYVPVDLKRRGAASLLILAAVLAGGALGGSGGRSPVEEPMSTRVAVTTPVRISLYVAGWVLNPGVFVIAPDALVADAILAAGGARPGARLDSLNLARPVVDGDHIDVPGPADAVSSRGSSGSGLISLNRANAMELEDLPGVGPVLADRIVAFREANGLFEQVEDLLEVPGIGESKLASIRDLVTVP